MIMALEAHRYEFLSEGGVHVLARSRQLPWTTYALWRPSPEHPSVPVGLFWSACSCRAGPCHSARPKPKTLRLGVCQHHSLGSLSPRSSDGNAFLQLDWNPHTTCGAWALLMLASICEGPHALVWVRVLRFGVLRFVVGPLGPWKGLSSPDPAPCFGGKQARLVPYRTC